jgi:CheY-like chemotaxis protein
MIHILVVEDDTAKRSRIARVLTRVPGLDSNNIEYVSFVQEASNRLRERLYDVLVLDINLPMRAEDDATAEAGINLLREIVRGRGTMKIPGHIIGITAYEDIYLGVVGEFSSRLLTLVQYEASSNEWEIALEARVLHILEFSNARAEEIEKYRSHLGIVCALYSPELTAVLNLPW